MLYQLNKKRLGIQQETLLIFGTAVHLSELFGKKSTILIANQ